MTPIISCPHCGGAPLSTMVRDGRRIVCEDCGAAGPQAFHGPRDQPDAEERARAGWNLRVTSVKGLAVAAMVERLAVKPGDLLVVTAAAETAEEVRALRDTLEPLSHELGVRIVAFPPTVSLKVVDGVLLAELYRLASGRLHRENWRGGGVSDATMARTLAEAAGELGLVIVKPERVAEPAS